MKLFDYSIFFLLICFLLVKNVFAENTVFINEFLIDPAPQQVEIVNIGTQSADISGWYIDDNGGSTYYVIPQSSILNPNACLVFSGEFNLNKSSADTVRLFNTTAPPTSVNANLIDSFSYKSSSGSGISYLRLPDGTENWTTKSASLGMYNETRLSCIITPTSILFLPTQSPTGQNPDPTPPEDKTTPIETPSPSPASYSNMYISEAMINPPSGDNEWVELFNNNDYSVSLINWFIDDIENAGSSPKLFSLDIPAKSFGVIEVSSSMFNNTGDNIRLLDFNKNLLDSFEYSSSQQGKTLGRISYDSDRFCVQEPSKNSANTSCIDPTSTPQPTPTKTPEPTPTTLLLGVKPSAVLGKPVYSVLKNPFTEKEKKQSNGETLGATIHYKESKSTIRYLSFLSLSYSLLTICSIFLKMKRGYENNF